MTEFLQNLFGSIFENNVILATILISMLPIIELRVGIPFGMATDIWGAAALSYGESFLFAFIGSSMVVLILAPIIKPLINWLKKTKAFKKVVTWFENKILLKTKKIQNINTQQTNLKKSRLKKFLGVFTFVAVPLPLTGVWTGTCVAVFLGLNYFETISSVILGNLTAGIIMMLISLFFKDNSIIVIYVFMTIVALLIIITIIKAIIRTKKSKRQDVSSENIIPIENNNNNE